MAARLDSRSGSLAAQPEDSTVETVAPAAAISTTRRNRPGSSRGCGAIGASDADPEERYNFALAAPCERSGNSGGLPNSRVQQGPSPRGRCPVLTWPSVPSRAVRPCGDDLLKFGLSAMRESSTRPCGSPSRVALCACRPGMRHLCVASEPARLPARPLYRAAGGAEPGRQLRWLISGRNLLPPTPWRRFLTVR